MTRALPRFSRKEIRDFAEQELKDWEYTGDDADGHATFIYPPNGGTYKLPETPRYFPVARNRALVQKLMGTRAETRRSNETIRARQANQQRRASQQSASAARQRNAYLGRIAAQDQRAAQQATDVANELGCTPRQADKRRRELQNIARLMGGSGRGF